MARLSRICLYPVKSLPGVSVAHATLTARGALAHDREYRLLGADGILNGKRNARIHQLDASCAIDGDNVLVTIGVGATAETFALKTHDGASQRARLEARLSHYFGEPVRVECDAEGGFPDDPDAPGPTIAAEASLAAVAAWYPGLTVCDVRRRFRANLEVGDCPAFWEDHLFGDPGAPVKFSIGDAHWLGTNPCKRCVVPTRDPSSGAELSGFQRTFVQHRKASLPVWANRAQFDFCYRFATNTRAARNASDTEGKRIRVGDSVEIVA
jgi:uncharacterized protein YcbX